MCKPKQKFYKYWEYTTVYMQMLKKQENPALALLLGLTKKA
jgi:hypothetical protein